MLINNGHRPLIFTDLTDVHEGLFPKINACNGHLTLWYYIEYDLMIRQYIQLYTYIEWTSEMFLKCRIPIEHLLPQIIRTPSIYIRVL